MLTTPSACPEWPGREPGHCSRRKEGLGVFIFLRVRHRLLVVDLHVLPLLGKWTHLGLSRIRHWTGPGLFIVTQGLCAS